jgi:hypothetical protein
MARDRLYEAIGEAMSERQHYLCEFRLGGKRLYVVWYSDTRDGLLVSTNRTLVSFESPEQARAYASSHAIALESQHMSVFDYDLIESWCGRPLSERIDCGEFLNAWNMFADVASSLEGVSEFVAANAGMTDIYEKVFYGNNLPSITPEGQHYKPTWSVEEVKALADLLSLGLQELRRSLSA